jgi:hypothetical protein
MVRITKQERKYNIKTTEEKPKAEPKADKAVKVKPVGKFRVLIDNANFMIKKYDSYEEAEQAGREFTNRSNSSYMVVEGCN